MPPALNPVTTEQGEVKPTRYLPPGTSDDEIYGWVEHIFGQPNIRFKAIRVYRGSDLIDQEFEAR
jgi:hypothetical protein